MKNRKKIAALLILLYLTAFVFSGCSLVGSFSNGGIEEMMKPPMPSGENYGIQQALETETSGEITLKYPKSGEYQSAYTTHDVDNDNVNEAIVFYQEKTSASSDIYIHLLKKEGDSWVGNGRIIGKGSEIYAVYFYDLDNDGKKEILVMWELYDSKTKRQLAVYSLSGELVESAGITCTGIAVLNMTEENKRMDLVAFSIEQNEVSSESTATLYSYSSSGLASVDTISLSSNIIGFAQIAVHEASNDGDDNVPAYVLIDAYYNDEKHLLSNIISWDAENKKLTLPLYDEEEAVSKIPVRDVTLTSRDVNADGIYEIPISVDYINTFRDSERTNATAADSKFEVSEKYQTTERMVAWVTYRDFEPVTEFYSLVNQTFNYMLLLPEDWVDDIAPVFGEGKDECILYRFSDKSDEPDGTYLTIRAFSNTKWQENTDNSYQLVKINGNLVYTIRYGNYDYPLEEISSMIMFIE